MLQSKVTWIPAKYRVQPQMDILDIIDMHEKCGCDCPERDGMVWHKIR